MMDLHILLDPVTEYWKFQNVLFSFYARKILTKKVDLGGQIDQMAMNYSVEEILKRILNFTKYTF